MSPGRLIHRSRSRHECFPELILCAIFAVLYLLTDSSGLDVDHLGLFPSLANILGSHTYIHLQPCQVGTSCLLHVYGGVLTAVCERQR